MHCCPTRPLFFLRQSPCTTTARTEISLAFGHARILLSKGRTKGQGRVVRRPFCELLIPKGTRDILNLVLTSGWYLYSREDARPVHRLRFSVCRTASLGKHLGAAQKKSNRSNSLILPRCRRLLEGKTEGLE